VPDIVGRATAARDALIDLARAGDVNAAIELMLTDERAGHPHLGKPLRQAPVHVEWQRLWDKERRCVMWSSPESGKTTQVIGRILSALGRNPFDSTAYFSANEDLPGRVVQSVKAHIERNEMLRKIWPRLKPGTKWTDTELHIAGSSDVNPSLVATSIGGNITGLHPNRIVLDDILVWKNTRTPGLLKDTLDWVDSNAVSGRLAEGGQMLLINQAYDPHDAAHEIAARPGWTSRRYPVVRPDGSPAFPGLWSRERIEDKRQHTTPLEFARQMMCVSYDLSTQRFKDEWTAAAKQRGQGKTLVESVDDILPGWFTLTGVDLGWTNTANSDKTVLSTILVAPTGDWSIIGMESGRFSADLVMDKVVDHWKRYKSTYVIVENAAGQNLLVQLIGAKTPVPVIPFETGKKKHDPTFGLEAMSVDFANGKVSIPNRRGVCHPEVQQFCDDIMFYRPTQHSGDHLMSIYFCWEAKKRMLMGNTKPKVGARTVGGATAPTNGHAAEIASYDDWGRL